MILTKAFPSQEQRKLESIAQKRAKRKARKATKRAELEIIETTKKTPRLQNIDTFDSSACNEPDFGQYSKATDFLQHLEQCKHLYRKSDLLALLPKCLCGLASEWFKTQSEFTSLKRFGRALAKAFPETSVRRASRSSNLQLSTLDVIPESRENASGQQAVQGNCKIYKQSFNSNNELYEHIRNHEALKPAKDSHLSINAANLVCETKEKPSATHVPPAPLARPQKSIFESAVASEAVTLLKQSALQPPALETTPEPTERLSMCRHCTETFNSKEMLRQHKREQHAKRPAVSPHLLINAAKSACESIEISTANSSSSASLAIQLSEPSTPSELPLPAPLGTFNPNRPHQDLEKRRFNQATIFIQHLQQCQHLCCESELLEWMEVILCGPADTWFGNQPNFTSLHDFGIALTKAFPPASPELQASIATPKQKSESTMTPEAVTSLKDPHLSYIAPETVLESEENESTQCSFTSPEPSPQTFESELQETSVQESPDTCSPLSKNTANSTSEVAEKSSVTCPPPPQEPPTPPATPRNLVIDTDVLLQPVSPKGLHLSITTSGITPKDAETTSDSVTETAEAAEIFAESIASIRTQAARIRVRLEAERAALQESALEFAPKPMEEFSIQQIVCARICRRCKQSFNFNNKLHEHIRQHHARKPAKSSDLRFPTPESTCKIKKKSSTKCPPAPLAPPTPPATSRSQTASAKIASQFLSSKCSNLPIATYKIRPKPMKSAVAICPLTSSSISSTSVRKHQEPHNQKSYLTVDDLSRMFAEKPRSFGLQQHHNRRSSSQSFDVRQHRFAFAEKSYLTIENLFEMFGGKSRRTDLFQGRNNVPSQASSKQSRITIYFKPAVNQKPSISQNSKSSKSKSLNQHMPAKSIRTVSSESLPEKSAKLPYKMLDVSGETPSFISILLRLFPAFLLALAFVSAISAARMSCISAYQQAILAIGHASIGFVAPGQS